MYDANALPLYQERVIFVQEQIKKCLKTIQKNLKEIGRTTNRKEANMLEKINIILQRKTEYLIKELEDLTKKASL